MEDIKALSVGDRVQITEEGVQAHQQHHDDHIDVIANVPVPIVGSVAKATKQIVFTFPEPGWKGTIVEARERWLWQSGHDYLVWWDGCSGQSWHLSKHLQLIE